MGVPESIALRLTKPVGVTDYNLEHCREMIRKGPHEIGGAVYCTRRVDGSRWDLQFITGSLDNLSRQLCTGDIVERTLIDGDHVIINRQPSLHKYSLLGVRVKVQKFSTFRLNLSITSPLNADFELVWRLLCVPRLHCLLT